MERWKSKPVRIDVFNKQSFVTIHKRRIKKAAQVFLKYLKCDKDSAVNIFFVTKKKIQAANRVFFKKQTTTDVIAVDPGKFAGNIYKYFLGDILICPEVAKQNSRIFETNTDSEILLYVAHGILHLLGYDDLKVKDKLKMDKKQNQMVRLLTKGNKRV